MGMVSWPNLVGVRAVECGGWRLGVQLVEARLHAWRRGGVAAALCLAHRPQPQRGRNHTRTPHSHVHEEGLCDALGVVEHPVGARDLLHQRLLRRAGGPGVEDLGEEEEGRVDHHGAKVLEEEDGGVADLRVCVCVCGGGWRGGCGCRERGVMRWVDDERAAIQYAAAVPAAAVNR